MAEPVNYKGTMITSTPIRTEEELAKVIGDKEKARIIMGTAKLNPANPADRMADFPGGDFKRYRADEIKLEDGYPVNAEGKKGTLMEGGEALFVVMGQKDGKLVPVDIFKGSYSVAVSPDHKDGSYDTNVMLGDRIDPNCPDVVMPMHKPMILTVTTGGITNHDGVPELTEKGVREIQNAIRDKEVSPVSSLRVEFLEDARQGEL